MPSRRVFLIALLTTGFAAGGQAHSYTAGKLAIGHVWGLPSETNETQVFAPLSNRGAAADELVAARSSICSAIELRQNNRYDEPELKAIQLLPAKPVSMRKGGRHLRLIGLTRSLKAGDRFDLVLDFLNGGEVAVEVIVKDGSGH